MTMSLLGTLGILCGAALLSPATVAQTDGSRVQPHAATAATLRIWGDTYMQSVVLAWEQHFRQHHPEVQFENRLMGTDTAMSGLYTGNADIALLGRDSNTTENDGFLHTIQYPPLKLRLMTGSLDVPGESSAPVLFVHKELPLEELTLAQLDFLIGCGQSHAAPPQRWGDLGLAGVWKDKPIHVYTYDAKTGTGLFLLTVLQAGSRKMNWQIIREFRNGSHVDGTRYDAGEQIMDGLMKDPYGLAISSLHYANPKVKALKLARTQDSEYVAPTRDTLIDGSYPLTRTTYVFLNRPPKAGVAPLTAEFLRFIYSDEGRKLVEEQSGFLPLTAKDAADQLDRLP